MELTQLNYFKVVAECEHFTRASEQLYISQPSLSKAISNLEYELGLKLFERDKKSVYLNEYGKVFYSYISKIFLDLDEASAKLKDMSTGIHGDIKIAFSIEVINHSPFNEYSRQFLLQHMDISLHFYQQTVKQFIKMLENREVMFGVSLKQENLRNIIWTPLFTDRLGVILHKNHALASKKTIRIEDLRNEKFLCNNVAPDEEDSVYHFCKKAGFTPKVIFEGPSSKFVGEIISKGIGISFASERRNNWMKIDPAREPWEDELLFIPVENEYCKREIGIAYLKNRYMPVAAKIFYDGIIDFFQSGQY